VGKRRKTRKIRKAGEFDLARLAAEVRSPVKSSTAHTWSLQQIRDARASQLRGQFSTPARLAESFRTDDALFTAYQIRLDPQRCLAVKLEPPNETARVGRVAAEAEPLYGQDGVGFTPGALDDIAGDMANHGLGIGVLRAVPRDGVRVDLILDSWPIEWVRWDPVRRCLLTQVDRFYTDIGAESPVLEGSAIRAGSEVPIVHGDGRWVVFSKHSNNPWNQDACLLPGALIWARHAHAIRDWSKGSAGHGNAKVVGKMPEGMSITDDAGTLTTEAAAFLTLLQAIGSLDTPVGIAPSGSEVDYITNSTNAWQVWDTLALNAEKAAARVYLGTDGSLGAAGGAPGVDIATLFGVATTKVQGDLEAFERAILTGVLEPWAAINFGDSSMAPKRVYQIPDPDAEGQRDAQSKNEEAFHAEMGRLTEGGYVVDQATVNKVAALHGVGAPMLVPADSGASVPSVTLAPTDVAKVTKVNEARASAGLPPLMLPNGAPDPDGDLMVAVFAALAEAAPEAGAAPKPGGPPPLALVPPPKDDAPPEPAKESFSQRQAHMLADIKDMRDLGFVVDTSAVEMLAEKYGVPAPKLAGQG